MAAKDSYLAKFSTDSVVNFQTSFKDTDEYNDYFIPLLKLEGEEKKRQEIKDEDDEKDGGKWRMLPNERMEVALHKLWVGEASTELADMLLGSSPFVDGADLLRSNNIEPFKQPDTVKSAPNLPSLNQSQLNAIKHALERHLSLIQGPPGTGKTVTSANIIYQFVKQGGGKVLACAHSNTAVNQLAQKLHQAGLKIIRIESQRAEKLNGPLSVLSLAHKLKYWTVCREFKELQAKKDQNIRLKRREWKQYNTYKSEYIYQVLKEADVICCTCVGAGENYLCRFRFKAVLVDECVQAIEPECLVPIMLGAEQIVLVGDQCQLGPLVLCQKAARAGLERSLFERLIALGVRPFRLDVQYRMHPEIANFPSLTFYEGSLENGVTAEDRRLSIKFPWPQTNCPLFFWHCQGKEAADSGTSLYNKLEAKKVQELAAAFLKAGFQPQKMGIITPYEGQSAYLAEYLHSLNPQTFYINLEVANVDGFQGREKDIIIISCVRSNDRQAIGFLSDSRRLNVALTRAKHGIIIVGNAMVLTKQPLWKSLIKSFKDRKVLVEGPLDNLQQFQLDLDTAKPYSNRRNSFNSGAGYSRLTNQHGPITDITNRRNNLDSGASSPHAAYAAAQQKFDAPDSPDW